MRFDETNVQPSRSSRQRSPGQRVQQ
jgi:hypothetical protein